jgi:hypothetical protein
VAGADKLSPKKGKTTATWRVQLPSVVPLINHPPLLSADPSSGAYGVR